MEEGRRSYHRQGGGDRRDIGESYEEYQQGQTSHRGFHGRYNRGPEDAAASDNWWGASGSHHRRPQQQQQSGGVGGSIGRESRRQQPMERRFWPHQSGSSGSRDGGSWRRQQSGSDGITTETASWRRQQSGGGGTTETGSWRQQRPGGSGEPAETGSWRQQSLAGGGEPTETRQQSSGGGGLMGREASADRNWGPSSSSTTSYQNQKPCRSFPDPVQLDVPLLRISDQKPLSYHLEKTENIIVPLRRPDSRTFATRSISLVANHFPVKFNPSGIIMHYAVHAKLVSSIGHKPLKRSIPKSLMGLLKEQLFSNDPKSFPSDLVAYDGERNIFSAVPLPSGDFKVEISHGEDVTSCSYIVTIKKMNELKLSRLKEYLNGDLLYIPRDILHGMDLVMKENPSKYRIRLGRNFFCKNYREGDDLKHGVAAYRGFQQSLKPTSQGLSLCLDYSVLSFLKPLPVLEFLKENIEGFREADDATRMRRQVLNALKGLKVRVTHRITKQKFTISGLTEKVAGELWFDLVDADPQAPPKKIKIVDFFWQKYEKEIRHLNVPCLDLGNANKIHYVPMEFCVLVVGQRYPKERLDRKTASFLKKLSLASPEERRRTICDMVQAKDGPDGTVAKNFQMEMDYNMTSLEGRVLGAPVLRLGAANGNVYPVRVDQEKCNWNLDGKSVVEGKPIERWALIDFTLSSRCKLQAEEFIKNLRHHSAILGIHMEDPLVCHFTGMHEFSSIVKIERLLRMVISDARHRSGSQATQLQLIICVMAGKDPGYKYLKWVSETKIGVVTQCCLSLHANKGEDKFMVNLCLKMNAKLGGSNVELNERFPDFADDDYVMFIGADVNHPAARNSTSPSIAAVVGTINWPAANQYAARVQPQDHRKEKIMNFGSICRDLVSTYAQRNMVRPKKIIVFRDGVSEGQFDMVLNEELLDLKQAICDVHYQPTITLVVAQKRHQTRLFLNGRNNEGVTGNVPPGTVVDTKIIHPFEFDFYLCSHYGSLGTSKPTHYNVLWDENAFETDKLQKLIYHLCFTFARCTKPVSLVPPVYYADLVAYRGRLFQEVVTKQSSAPLWSTSAISSASLSSSAASFNQNFYTLHPDLQNIMYFV
ncbi:unnamed protein product [Coffea canephora]|uniref:Piwi domain-containing protein n=1 Tax=Coffea canephora TaxID=49390 RepID=A0A068VD65_COFCA|nr:unnamed protein product [Coffea canephora]